MIGTCQSSNPSEYKIFMATSGNSSLSLEQLCLDATRGPFPSSESALGSMNQQHVFISSTEAIYPSQDEPYSRASFSSFPSQFSDPLLADSNAVISVEDHLATVEEDEEEWTSTTSLGFDGPSTYDYIQIPNNDENVLIAKAQSYSCKEPLPWSSGHGTIVLTSTKHIVEDIPPKFQQWIHHIHHFLRKSEVYLHPSVYDVKIRHCLGIFLQSTFAITVFLSCLGYSNANEICIIYCLVMIPLFVVGTRGLANGVEELKLCGKYEQSMLPPNIKVVLGPYGVYWKFVLRS